MIPKSGNWFSEKDHAQQKGSPHLGLSGGLLNRRIRQRAGAFNISSTIPKIYGERFVKSP
jgi:hypothetical protein